MIVRNLDECRKTDRRIVAKTWESTRLLLRGDEMGYSFHITTIYGGTETEMCYENHLETVYCISGRGTLESLVTGQTWNIFPGQMYALNEHDRHIVRAETDLELACVFNPPLYGTEVHNENGVYPTEADVVSD
ncbi:MAG: ectoine synthase [Gammaproteobacteria bacterium]|nr:ectoine synthase [Gammaproteobacteria bacterium]MCP5198505.1 ectoine synthase [Gammaproteobacteria bacterium]